MDLSETLMEESTQLSAYVNNYKEKEDVQFYSKLYESVRNLYNCLNQCDTDKILNSKYVTVYSNKVEGVQLVDARSNEIYFYRLTYNKTTNRFYLNGIKLWDDIVNEIKDGLCDFNITVGSLESFQNWVLKSTKYLSEIAGITDLSDVPSDLIAFMNLDESYKYLKELEAFVNEYKDRAFMNFNIVDNPPLVEESSYRLNLIQESPSKEIVLRCYYDNQLGEEIQEYDCPLALSKSELETLLADTKIEWGTMCYDALEALYDLVSVEKVKERTSINELMTENGLVTPTGILQRMDSTIIINLTVSINNLSAVLQSLSTNNITLNIDLKE